MGYIFLRFLNVFITNLISCLGIRILYKHNTFNDVFYWKQLYFHIVIHPTFSERPLVVQLWVVGGIQRWTIWSFLSNSF